MADKAYRVGEAPSRKNKNKKFFLKFVFKLIFFFYILIFTNLKIFF